MPVSSAASVESTNRDGQTTPICGEASFTPDTVDELITTVRELIEMAKRARERRPALTEHTVPVGA